MGRRRNAKDYSEKLDLDELAKLFGLPTQEGIDEDIMNATSDLYGYAYKEALREREREQADLWKKYQRAVEETAEHFFDQHHLSVTEDVDHPGVYMVEAKSWEKAADEIRQTINGVGYFEFANLEEFLESGPYTAKEAVLSHLHWMKDYAAVYGETSPQRIFERAMR